MKKGIYEKYIKRFLDIVLSFIGIVYLSPIMLMIAIIVKLDSKGPAIFASKRVGKEGKIFDCYKFRSMINNAPHEVATRDIDGEQYITKVGKFIRKTSLDELPQLFNILKGDMSFIGYRPVVVTETELLDKRNEYGVNKFRPGLSGLAQVNGRDKIVDMEEKAKLDMEYCKNIKFLGDVKLFFKSFAVALSHSNVVEGKQANAYPQEIIIRNTDVPMNSRHGKLAISLSEVASDIQTSDDSSRGMGA